MEREIVLVAEHETVRTAVGRLSILLPQVRGQIDVGCVPRHVRQILAERVCPLESEAAREVLTNGYLQAVVVIHAIETVLLKPRGQVSQNRHTSYCIRRCVGGES